MDPNNPGNLPNTAVPANPANLPMTIEGLAHAYEQLLSQFNNAQGQIGALQSALQANQAVHQAINQAMSNAQPSGPKPKQPESFKGKGSVSSWALQMSNYLAEVSEPRALSIAVSYLDGAAHEWWVVFKTTPAGQAVESWPALKVALLNRFETLNKVKIARDKLAKWKQIKDVSTFNDDFHKIILDIPNISVEEQIDRYTRGLKPYIWKELCTREYENLSDAMRDAERVESAHKRLGKPPRPTNPHSGRPPRNDDVVPMDIGNVQLKKLTPAEREQCKKEGKCFRCRMKGNMAKNCPKARGN